MSNKNKIELLSPAGNLDSGLAAINCGADAVYIGAPKFGARSAAGNSLADIEKLVIYAHKFRANVYVTINTILYDNELDEAKKLIIDLYNLGVDAIIFQDMSILEMDIPPVTLFASTQTHNYDIKRIKFLDELGIKRIILARELSLEEIAKIKFVTKAELEFFIHGALCVCQSGQCYLSHALTGRSANRGECSQPCRMKYTLTAADGKIIVKDKHLLSLKDLNLSEYLWELMQAGITSFKIEGRLKDTSYVKNITAYYRQHIDALLDGKNLFKRSSFGKSIIHFTPDPNKTFNRGYTTHFIEETSEPRANFDTPKSMGEPVGKVVSVSKYGFNIESHHEFVNGDGLCFINNDGELTGFNINRLDKNFIFYDDTKELKAGTEIYRNYDKKFYDELKKNCKRKIRASFELSGEKDSILLTLKDEENIVSELKTENKWEESNNPEAGRETIERQLKKSGDTIFEISDVTITTDKIYFIPVAELNYFRRKLLELHETKRISSHPVNETVRENKAPVYPARKLSFKTNVTNELAKRFYENHGVEIIEEGFELKEDYHEAELMTCKYCLKDELGHCIKKNPTDLNEQLYLINNNKKFRLQFNCSECKMSILMP